MKLLIFSVFLVCSIAHAQTRVQVATFDSGFGGYFTAKEIERTGNELQRDYDLDLSINHFGDTANAPYGSRTPNEIAGLSAAGISKAFDSGAEYVFIACNTASTQFSAIQALLKKTHPDKSDKIISIIESSVSELKRQVDLKLKNSKSVSVTILATPATIKAGAYIKAFAEAYGIIAPKLKLKIISQDRWNKKKGNTIESVSAQAFFKLPHNKEVIISQIGPANWVELIELGAPLALKKEIIGRDLRLLAPKKKWDIVGEFCTHFPAIDHLIHEEGLTLGLTSSDTSYIKQGPLMANLFRKLMSPRLVKSKKASNPNQAKAKIFISGENIEETKNLAKEIFPTEELPEVSSIKF